MAGHARITQERIVFASARFLFVLFAVGLHNFLTAGNLIWLTRGVAALGMLGLGMGLVVIGRGIDLAMVATMVVAVSWCFSLAQAGIGFGCALLIGAAFVIVVGRITGVLVAYADIPAIFRTLAMGLAVYGVGRAFFFTIDVQNVPDNAGWFSFPGDGSLMHVPMPIIAFALLTVIFWCCCAGRASYATGDDLIVARIAGIPMRNLIVAQYILSGRIAYATGLVMAASVQGASTIPR